MKCNKVISEVKKATKLIKKSAMLEFIKSILKEDCPKNLDLISANKLSGLYSQALRRARRNV